MKKRIFLLIMCAVMMVSSFAVMAKEEEFGSGNDRAIAKLYVVDSFAVAETTPLTPYITISTRVRIVGPKGSTPWVGGTTYASRVPGGEVDDPYLAESFHAINGTSKYLTVSY